MWRGAGVAVPVFSLRTRDSVGAGEFLDLLQLIQLCCECVESGEGDDEGLEKCGLAAPMCLTAP